jgi:Ca-activated chloride channel family protein
MNAHDQMAKLLAVYRDLSDGERRRVEGHVQGCATCAARLASYQAMDRELAALADPQPDQRTSESFYAALDDAGQRAAPTRRPRPARRAPRLLPTALSLAVLAVIAVVSVSTMLGDTVEEVFSQVSNTLGLGEGDHTRTHYTRLGPSQAELAAGDASGLRISEGPFVPLSAGGTAIVNDEPYDLTFYESYGVNPFIDTEDDHLSTFAMDVDTASYSIARRYLRDGHLPDKDAVRVEEFVNYFRQEYDAPGDPGTAFAIHLEGAPAPFGGARYHLLRVGLQGYRVPDEARQEAALVFVIDVSGSMERENRLGLVKRALRLLVDELRPTDTVGIVVYGSRGQVLLEPTPASERESILSAIELLEPEGSTNAEEGLLLGYQMAAQHLNPGGINRLILCSDGVANVGRTGPEGILGQIQSYADQGITLSAVGFGMGNYNDVLMEQLADRGDGNYAYVDTLSEARRVFVENLTGMLQVIARDAKVQVDFNPQVVSRYRLLGYENRDVADEDFRKDEVDAGEVGAGHSVTALYEIKLREDAEAQGTALTVTVRYEQPDSGQVIELARAFARSDFRPSLEETTPRFRLAAAVAEFAEILRRSYWAREGDLEAVLALARGVAQELPDDADVAELVELVARASDLWAQEP